jgi:hypothetical protein
MRVAALLLLAGCGRFGFGDDGVPDGAVIDAPAVNYADVVLADTPVAYWRFRETPGTTTIEDVTGNGHTGTLNGTASLGEGGLLSDPTDHSILFDGSTGYVEVPDSAPLRFGGTVSLEAWISPSTFANASAMSYPRIIGKGNAGGTGHTLCVEKNATADTALARVELEGLTPFTLDGSTVLLPNKIHHLVATFDGTTVRMYVDGQLDGAQAVTGILQTSTAPLDIGRRPDAMRYWQGLVDEVAVYDHVLSPERIAAHYAAGR